MNNKNQFGVWMDNHHATIVGNGNEAGTSLRIVAHVKGETTSPNSSEKNFNNDEKTLAIKFLKKYHHILLMQHMFMLREQGRLRNNLSIIWHPPPSLKIVKRRNPHQIK